MDMRQIMGGLIFRQAEHFILRSSPITVMLHIQDIMAMGNLCPCKHIIEVTGKHEH
jgi:hypothetical protein